MIEMNSSHEQKIWSEQAAAFKVAGGTLSHNDGTMWYGPSDAAKYADEMILEYRKRVGPPATYNGPTSPDTQETP